MINVSYGHFTFLNASGYTVPLVSISKDVQRNGAGKEIGGTYNINLEGKIIVPTGTGPSGLSYLLSRESGLRRAFSVDGYNLSIGNFIYTGIKVNRYNVDKTDNNWTNNINYSIDLISEIDSTGNNSGCFLVSNTQDDWSIEVDGETSYSPQVSLSPIGFSGTTPNSPIVYPLYKITRTLSAVGKYQPLPPISDTIPLSAEAMTTGISALKNAEQWIKYHLDNFSITNIISGLTLYNFTRSINKSDTEGSYRLSDTWLASNTGLYDFTETFTIDSSLDNNMIRTVNINGTIKGLEKFDTSKNLYYNTELSSGIKPTTKDYRLNDKFSNAISGYLMIKPQIYHRARQFATTGITYGSFSFPQTFKRIETNSGLNPIPATANETYSPIEGSITYSYSYTNKPQRIISGSITENVTLNDKNAVPIVASIPIFFRSNGPIFQDLGTFTSSTRTVSITATFPKARISDLSFPPSQYVSISGMLDRFDPANLAAGLPNNPQNKQYIKSIVKSDNIDWNVNENSITAQKSWEWTISYTGANNG